MKLTYRKTEISANVFSLLATMDATKTGCGKYHIPILLNKPDSMTK